MQVYLEGTAPLSLISPEQVKIKLNQIQERASHIDRIGIKFIRWEQMQIETIY